MGQTAVVAGVRDALVTLINGLPVGKLPTGLAATAAYIDTVDLEKLDGGRILVVPVTRLSGDLSRAGPQRYEVVLHVATQFKMPAAGQNPGTATTDPYLAASEFIATHHASGGLIWGDPAGLGGQQTVSCVEARFPQGLFIDEHLRKFRVFTSVVELTFNVRA